MHIIGRHTLYVTSGNNCFKYTVNRGKIQRRVFLCWLAVRKIPDTDVAVLGISFCGTGALTCKLLFLTGTQHRKRYVNLSAIGEILWNYVCEGLLGAHAFTGFDTVSAFHGFGKTKVLKLLMNNYICCAAMQQLGTTFDLADIISTCEKAVCVIIYGYPQQTEVNVVRHLMFGCKTTDPSRLPPCHDVLVHQIQRANYQSFIWRSSMEAETEIPSPADNRWANQGSSITIKWMSISPAPNALIEIIHCSCKRFCGDTSCNKNNLKCTNLCKCSKEQCINQQNQEEADRDSDFE